LDPRGRKSEEDGADGKIWTQERGIERRIELGGKVWTQEGGRERRIMLGGMFGPKREDVIGGWC